MNVASWCHRAGATCSRSVPPASNSFVGKKAVVEKLWRKFLSDPSRWWDHRLEKGYDRYPDFKHKETQESLWISSKWNPPWVEAELSAIAPGILQPNIFPWNRRLSRYVKAREHGQTLKLFHQMQQQGLHLDKFSFLSVLNACAAVQALDEGRCIHKQIIQSGCALDIFVGASLVTMYANCGSISDACKVFDKMPTHDLVSWNAIILGHVKCGHGERAFELFQQMQNEQVDPDPFTFVAVLNACASTNALEEGRVIHRQIVQNNYQAHLFVGNSLVDLYVKSGSIDDAWQVFNTMPTRDVVTWNTMIQGFVKCGQGPKALELSQQMQQHGVKPNNVTFTGMLNACAIVGALEEGARVHREIAQSNFEMDMPVANSLVDMYAKCGSIEQAWGVFSKMPTRDVVSWNAMILGLVHHGQAMRALELSRQMQQSGVEPDSFTFVGILNSCATLAALEEGRSVEKHIKQSGCQSDIVVGNCLVKMYAKCGSVEDAQRAFEEMPIHDKISWSTMLAAFAMHGHGKEAGRHFEQMCKEDVELNGITFVSLLSACSHAGLVDEGLHHFESMSSVHNISPSVQHYACVVDLLSRTGRLHEAEDLIQSMPCQPDVSVWTSLLSGCRLHGDVEMAERTVETVIDIDPNNAGVHVLLSNIFSAAGKWDQNGNVPTALI